MEIDFSKLPANKAAFYKGAVEDGNMTPDEAVAAIRKAFPDAIIRVSVSVPAKARKVLTDAIVATDALETLDAALGSIGADYYRAGLSDNEAKEGEPGIKIQTRLFQRDVKGAPGFQLVLLVERKPEIGTDGKQTGERADRETWHTMQRKGKVLTFPTDGDAHVQTQTLLNSTLANGQLPSEQSDEAQQ